jgi:Uma2 family endonuclease
MPVQMESVLEKLYRSPKLSLYLQTLQNKFKEEQQQRQAFYNWVDEDMKAEFINGQFIVHSPVTKMHNVATKLLFQLMNVYAIKYELGFVGIEKIMVSLSRNDYEPDICFWTQEKAQAFTDQQKLFPAPDWIVEVLSKSTAKTDRGIKFEDYQAHGAKEYWLISPSKKTITQYVLEEDKYKLVFKGDNGLVRSRAMKGFEVAVEAVFDEKKNLQALGKILGPG